MMKIPMLVLSLIAATLSSSLYGDEVSLPGYLESVRQNHPFFARERISRDIEHQQQQRFLGDEDWVVTANPFYRHEERSWGNAFIAEKENLLSLSVGMERLFWSSGSRVAVAYDYNRLDRRYAPPTGVFDEHAHGVSVTYSVPLLKNKNGILNRLNYDLQAFNIDLADVVALENQEDFLEQNGQLFLDWVFVTEQHRIANNRLYLAEEELQRTEKKRRSFLVAEVDVLRARDAVISAKQGLQRIEAQRKALSAELATQSGDARLYTAEPSFNLYALRALPDMKQALSTLKENSRLLKRIDLRLEQLTHQRTGLENKTKPELDLLLRGGLRSEKSEFSGSIKLDQPQYMVGMNFRYILGQRRAKADVSKTRMQQQQLRFERASIYRQLAASLRNTLVQLNELEGVMALSRQQIDVARQRTAEELRRHNQGRSELTFVIQSRDNEQNAQLNYAENAVSYQRLRLRYAALTDTLMTGVEQ